MNGALSDPYLVLLALFCVLTIGAIVTALHRVSRVELAQLKNELSGRLRELEAAEQRRFVRELNSHRAGAEGAEAKYAANGGGRLEAESPVQ
jgi:hypothetical protein